MKTAKHLKWLVTAVVSLFVLLMPEKLTAATKHIQEISQITKKTPLILQHASAATAVDLVHGSHVSHASHASHFSHYSSS